MAYERYVPEFTDKNGQVYGVMDAEAREEVSELNSALNNVSNVVYKTELNANDGLVPFHAKKNDIITIYTKDGSSFAAQDHLRFYDAAGTYLVYWGTGSTYGKFRTFTYDVNTEACYIGILKSGSTVYDYVVVNNSNEFIAPNINNMIPASYIVETDRLGIQNCIPFYCKAGDVVTFQTANGSAFSFDALYLLNANKEQVAYYSTYGYSGARTFTLGSDKQDVYYCYIGGGTAQKTEIINNSSIYNMRSDIDKRTTYNQVLALLGVSAENIFSEINKIDGKYVIYTTGNLSTLEGYSSTDYFSVFPGASYKLTYHASGSQIAYYDEKKQYVDGAVTSTDSITVPDNNRIVYARWCGETAEYSNWGLYLNPATSKKYITTTEGLLEGIIDAVNKNIQKVIVTPGTYDLIAEYKAKYGNDYFANYATDYNGLTNGYYDRGIWLNNIEVLFQAGSKVTAIYEGDGGVMNPNVTTYFSAFAMGQNVKIDGLVLDAKNLRYGIHPDWHPDYVGWLEIRNCDLHHYKQIDPGVNDNQAIGAGFDVHSTWLIENCIFRSDTSHPVFRVHNNVSSDAESKIVIKDCYVEGNGYILLNSYSTSEHQTIAQVSGCSWVNPVVVGKETQASNDNITLYAWNNETRQS